jgi:DNA polymerase-3 subunit gamma/tau
MSAEDDALELIARRAGGSMRDAQSLLDQVLAFGGDKLTSDVVHQLLGTAHDDRVLELASAVLNGDAKSALEILGRGADEGLQLGELLDQLLEYWRDLMVVSCSGIAARNLSIPQRHRETLAKQAGSLGLDVILAGMDVLSSAKARLRQSSHTRVILEMAIVRLSRLDDLISLAQIAQTLDQPGQSQGSSRPAPRAAPPVSDPPNAPVKKKLSDSLPDNVRTEATKVLSPDSLTAIWKEVRAQAGPFLSRHLEPAGLPAILGPNALVIRFAAEYNSECEHCQQPASVGRIEELLRKVTGQAIAVRIESLGGGASRTNGMAVAASEEPSRYHRQRSEALKEPLVKGAVELLAAQLMEVDERFGCEPTEPEPTEKAETEES